MDNVNVKISARAGPWAVWLGGGGVVDVGPEQCALWEVWLVVLGCMDVKRGCGEIALDTVNPDV